MAKQNVTTDTSTSVVNFPTSLFDDKSFADKVSQQKKSIKDFGGLIKLGVLGVGIWAFVKYALPLIMAMISPVIAAIFTFFAIMFSLAMIKPAWKWFTSLADLFRKYAIKQNPEREVEKKQQLLENMHQDYVDAQSIIKKTAAEFRMWASQNEEEAGTQQEKIESNQKKAKTLRETRDSLKGKVDELEAQIKNGVLKTQKDKEPFYQAQDELTTVEGELFRLMSSSKTNEFTMNSNIRLTRSYAAKAHIFSKFDRFLTLGAIQIESKKREFAVWWEATKKEIAASKAGKDATEKLRFILGPDNDVDLNTALAVINDQISDNYAKTAQLMGDFKRTMEGFDFNSDEAYDHLEGLLKKMEEGQMEIPSTREITSSRHTLTYSEKNSAGMLGNIFD